jgi:hypothetical protein
MGLYLVSDSAVIFCAKITLFSINSK